MYKQTERQTNRQPLWD